MSQYVNLEMNYTTFCELCDAVRTAAIHTEGYENIEDLVHLVDFLEEEYERDSNKQSLDYETWKLHEELFQNKEIYHHEYFYKVENVLDEYAKDSLYKWDIPEREKFHLICNLIDVFKKNEQVKE